MRTKMSRAPRKVSGSGAREARCSTTSTRRSRQKRSACGPKCRVRREKCPDRGRAKRVAARQVRVDRAKSGSHPDRITLLASNVAVTRVRKQSHQAHFSGENDWKRGIRTENNRDQNNRALFRGESLPIVQEIAEKVRERDRKGKSRFNSDRKGERDHA